MLNKQEISIPLPVGTTIQILDNCDSDTDGGLRANVQYECRVEKHVPETGCIEMEDGTKRAELLDKIESAGAIQVEYYDR